MRAGSLALTVATGLLMSSVASGYYHYIHFASTSAPFVAIPEKYDLSALRNKTVYYFVTDQQPTALATGDTVGGLISQIRLAASSWNAVSSSDLRVAFGGISSAGIPQNAPGIDFVFDDDIPPGLAAYGGVETLGSMVQPAGGSSFFPIVRGMVKVRHDLSATPSFGEGLFLTLVHEFGHSLGLQHTLTSSVMSTAVTRATTRSKPLADDDIAAISILYPTGTFLADTATITGQVSMGGAGVNLASVVAISANGSTVSTLTNPDGTYTLQGIPPGNYYVYVHPLPPALNGETTPGNIVPPRDPNGNPLSMTGYFTTQFYPGTRDQSAAVTISLKGGDNLGSINFTVEHRTAPALSSVAVYGFVDSNPVYPAPLIGSSRGAALVAAGTGLVSTSNTLASGLSINVLAASGATVSQSTVRYFSYPYLTFNAYPGIAWAPGPRHLLFNTRDDLYVLPAALLLVTNRPPTISSIATATDDQGNSAALISGQNFDSTTRIFFDGVAATVLRQNDDGSLLVTPPPATPGYRANVIGVNGDGQSSLFSQPNSVPGYNYSKDNPTPAIAAISPSVLPAGSEAMVEIDGVNTQFVDGQTVIGFGSSDIAVRHLWVTGPTRLLLNVSIPASGAPTQTAVTVVTGLQSITVPYGFQITAAPVSPQLVMVPPVVDAVAGTPGASAGAVALLNVSNLTAPAASLTLTVAGQPATIVSVAKGQVTFQVPAGLPTGPAVVALLTRTGDAIQPIVMNVNPPPPVIAVSYTGSGTILDASHPAHPGSILGLVVTGFASSILTANPASIKITVGGVDQPAFSVGSQAGGALIQTILSPTVPTGGNIPVTVTYAGVTSQSATIAVE